MCDFGRGTVRQPLCASEVFLGTLQFVYTTHFHLLRSLDHQVNQVSRNVCTYDILPVFIEGLRQEVSTPLS